MEDSDEHLSDDLQPDGKVQQVQDTKIEKFRKTVTEIIPLEGKKSYAIQVLTPKDEVFMIPVIDATDEDEARLTVEQMNKDANRARGSKYFKPSASLIGRSYNLSWKKDKK